MKTRIICLLLMLVMILSCFAGCFPTGNNGDGEGEGEGEGEGNNNPPVGPPDIGTSDEEEGDWWENIKYDDTELFFMMTNCDNTDELSSGCEQYLAGEFNDSNKIGRAHV